MGNNAPRRIIKGGVEQDVFTRWRTVLCWTQRAGQTHQVKKMAARRDRRQARQRLKTGSEE